MQSLQQQQQSTAGITHASTSHFTSSGGARGYRRRMRVSGLLAGAFALHVLQTARCLPLNGGQDLAKHKESPVSLFMSLLLFHACCGSLPVLISRLYIVLQLSQSLNFVYKVKECPAIVFCCNTAWQIQTEQHEQSIC